jgi:haloalkane dehalogenase
LESSTIPKLVLYGEPGFVAPEVVAQRAATHWKATEAASVGRGVHFLPEIQPAAVAAAIAGWYERTFE